MVLPSTTPEGRAAEREILDLLGLPHDECAIHAVVNHNLEAGTVEVINRKTDTRATIRTTEAQWARIVDIVSAHLQAFAGRKPHT